CRRSVIYLLGTAPDTVAGFENLDMMPLVPGDHECERADADRLAIRGAAPDPGIRVKCPQECQRRRACGAQFADEIDERARVELRSEEHTSELQSRGHLVCRLLLEKKKNIVIVNKRI